ncbi:MULTISPECIES: cation diffusion facilitator family transporter [Myxococcaceae]|jgi:divalent metal cation (Fe/Co/Zn/Cd) transporter|uniref:cation diffusion facilitator family transporter n=1 Tax=Myxococcaceae TaxID=31 RepID=UPI001CBF76E3|nr:MULTISPECIES: cation transporter [Myxococcaceae]MBZ4329665.1 cation transporter [Corallococcus sp. AS-1-12]MBZ4400597.1 cation transporter [Myxococcus sp. AS-1-15]
MSETATFPDGRLPILKRAKALTLVTVGWNLIEGTIAVAAALAAGSVALLGFGVDSFVESTSAAIMLWRLSAERRARRTPGELEQLDRRAHRLIGLSLFALAAFVAWEASTSLLNSERPKTSLVGLILATVSLAVMMWLARAKKRTAVALGSRAMEADALQTTACWWLSLITLGGIGLNAAFGWWWADPVAALGMTLFLVKEGREAWRGEDTCAACH